MSFRRLKICSWEKKSIARFFFFRKFALTWEEIPSEGHGLHLQSCLKKQLLFFVVLIAFFWGTATVVFDMSLISKECDLFRIELTSLSLEDVLHLKKYYKKPVKTHV